MRSKILQILHGHTKNRLRILSSFCVHIFKKLLTVRGRKSSIDLSAIIHVN